MCMNNLDDTRKRHRIGFKVLKTTEDPNVFESQVMGSFYTMNEWKDVGDPELLIPVSAVRLSPQGRRTYRAGIHYFHKIPHADLRYVDLYPHDNVIIKFKLKGIIETGIENGVEAGVARMACPVEVMNRSMLSKDYEGSNLKKHIKLTDGQFYIDMFNNKTFPTPNVAQLKAVVERVTESYENFCKYIMFIDMFTRKHDVFQFFTKVHTALYSGPHKDKIYLEYYYKLVDLDDDMVKTNMILLKRMRKLKIRSIHGPVA